MEFDRGAYTVLIQVSLGYSVARGTFPRVTNPSAAHPEGCARLACVKPAASVRSEPGSNSQVETVPRPRRTRTVLDRRTFAHPAKPPVKRPAGKRHRSLRLAVLADAETQANGEADATIIGRPKAPYVADMREVRPSKRSRTARKSLHHSISSMSARRKNNPHAARGATSRQIPDFRKRKPQPRRR